MGSPEEGKASRKISCRIRASSLSFVLAVFQSLLDAHSRQLAETHEAHERKQMSSLAYQKQLYELCLPRGLLGDGCRRRGWRTTQHGCPVPALSHQRRRRSGGWCG